MSRGITSKPTSSPRPEVKSKEPGASYTTNQNQTYTTEAVVEKLKEYTVVRKKSDRIRLAIVNCTAEIQDDKQLVVKVSNQIQADDIALVKNEMVNYLKRELQNSTIDFIIKITQTETKKDCIPTPTDLNICVRKIRFWSN